MIETSTPMSHIHSLEGGETRVGVAAYGGFGKNFCAATGAEHRWSDTYHFDLADNDEVLAATAIQLAAKGSGGVSIGPDAEAARQKIMETMADVKVLINVTCPGGQAGSSLPTRVAAWARAAGKVVVTIAVRPFSAEGPDRRQRAHKAIRRMTAFSDSVVTLDNDDLLKDPSVPLTQAFAKMNGHIAALVDETVSRIRAMEAAERAAVVTPAGRPTVPFLDMTPNLV